MMRRINCAAAATKWLRRCQTGFRIIDQSQVGFVENSSGLQRVAGALTAHVMVGEAVQFGLHQREQLLQRSLVPAAPVAEQLGHLLSRGWGVVIQALLDAANSNTDRWIFTARPGADQKKTAQSWRVSGGLSALAHEPAQQQTPEKPKQKPNLNKKNRQTKGRKSQP
jgi:hypothetical protein